MWFTSVFFWLWDRMEGKVLLILAQCLDGDHSCLTACSGAQSLLEVVISSFFLTCMVMKTYYCLPHLEWRASKLGFCFAKYRRFSFPRKRWVFWTWENNSAALHLGLPTSLAGVGTKPWGWVHRRGLGRGGVTQPSWRTRNLLCAVRVGMSMALGSAVVIQEALGIKYIINSVLSTYGSPGEKS